MTVEWGSIIYFECEMCLYTCENLFVNLYSFSNEIVSNDSAKLLLNNNYEYA